jgi:DUF438 domain-containing protein
MSELIDNRARRIVILKEIIEHLHKGEDPNAVKAQLREIVKQTSPAEVIAMEQELISGGVSVEEVRSMCDLHSQLAREVLVQLPSNPTPPGHPVDTFHRENSAIRQVVTTIRTTLHEISALPDHHDCKSQLLKLRQGANELMDIDKHYQRKEHVLFSFLEKHGIAGPSKVMWAKDDDVRESLKRMNHAVRVCTPTVAECKKLSAACVLPTLAAVEEMIFKEENILLPMSLQTLTENEWAEIWASSPKYGWCLVEPRQEYAPSTNADASTPVVPADGTISMPTGHFTLDQLTSVLSTLPLDLTFVDADDRVAFFTEGPDRIFARSKAIIGRKVQHCHPPSSVDTVDRILDDFRAGRQNVAEFWIDFRGKFVHIRYFAVRDKQGKYLGTVELTQNIAPLRALTGERRLLQYN